MERIIVNEKYELMNGAETLPIFALSSCEKPLNNLFLNDNQKLNFVINDLNQTQTLNVQLEKNAILELSILAKNDIKMFKMTANLKENASILIHFADFAVEHNNVNIDINLNGKNATAKWMLASLSAGHDLKNIIVNINHNAVETIGQVDNYGVCKDHSHLLFAGTSNIIKGSHASKTVQNAKIMVFDETAIATAKPILKIDENDIAANHAAGVGKINDEHLFYLTSRGLTTVEARQLITMGYLKPILKGFTDEEFQKEIVSLIERRL